MRAVRLIDSVPTVVEVPEPVPGPGDVEVRVASVGICGSDLHLVDSGWNPPGTLGHEICGYAPDGRVVAIEPLRPCGECEQCLEGLAHLCPAGSMTMIGVGTDGGMADRLVVPKRCLVEMPEGVDPRIGSLVEPVAVAVHGLRLAGQRGDDGVAIVGAGSVGLCALAAANAGRSPKARPIGVVARHDRQREAVETLGGTVLDDASTAGPGYELVVETAGTAEALAAAVRLARPGGRVLMLSMHWQPTATPGLEMSLKEITIHCSMTYGTEHGRRDIDRAAEVLAATPTLGDAVITHRFPLDAATAAFGVARDRSAGAIKVVLEP